MRDTLCVREINFNDLLGVKNEIYETIEELEELNNDTLNTCAVNINELQKRLILLEQGLLDHNKKWTEQEVTNEEQLDVKYRLEGQEVSTYINDKIRDELKENINVLKRQMRIQKAIISTLVCAIPIYFIIKRFF